VGEIKGNNNEIERGEKRGENERQLERERGGRG
jgi:hypothetical protein